MAYIDKAGNVVDPLAFLKQNTVTTDTAFDEEAFEQEANAEVQKMLDLDRAAELKRKEVNRKGELLRNPDGTLVHDTDMEIRAKEAGNLALKGADWLLEATENIVDFGQGDIIDRDSLFMVENQGKRYHMDNKDFLGARDTTTEQLIQDYQNAKHDPNAEKGIYTLRKFDGFNPDGTRKYIYKYGVADVSADKRYKDQWVQDGFDIVEEKRFAGAEDWEKKWNASQGVLDARVLDSDRVTDEYGNLVSRDEASGINFGAGKTELLDKDLLGTDIGKTEQDYERNKAFSKALTEEYEKEGYMDHSISGRALNTLAGFGSMAAKTLVLDTADFVSETLFDFDLGTEEEKRKLVNDLFNYDDRFAKENMAEITGHISKMMKNGEITWEGIGGVLKNAIQNVETTGESLGFLLGLTLGVGKFTKLGKTINNVEKLEKAGKITSAVAQTQKARLTAAATASQKASYMLANNVGMITVSAGMTNDQIDEFTANNNGEGPSAGHVAFMFGNTLVANLSERFIDLTVLKQSGLLKTTRDAITNATKAELPKILRDVTSTSGKLALSMGGEFAQEYYQTMSEIINKQWGTVKYGDDMWQVLTNQENIIEGLSAGSAGAGGAVHFAAAGKTGEYIQKGIGKYNEQNQAQQEETPVENPIAGSTQGTTNTESMDEVLDEIRAVVPEAQANEDGTYNKEDVLNEARGIYNNIVVNMRSFLENLTEDADYTKANLGTIDLTADQMIKAAEKSLNDPTLTADEKQELQNIIDEGRSLKKDVSEKMTQTLKKYTLEDIEKMSASEKINVFGAEPDFIYTPEDAAFDEAEKEVSKEESTQDPDDLLAQIDEEALEAHKKAALSEKSGNKEASKKWKAKAKQKAAKKKTLESIMNEDFYDEDRGIFAEASNTIDALDSRRHINQEIDRMKIFTKNWLVANGFGKKFEDITDDDIDAFLTPNETRWNRKAYYDEINNTGLRSIERYRETLSLIDKKAKNFKKKIDSLVVQKKSKLKAINKATVNAKKEIDALYKKLKNEGIPEDTYDIDLGNIGEDIPEKKIAIENPTHEQIIAYMKDELYGKYATAEGHKFKIYYKSIIEHIETKQDGLPKDVFKLLDTIKNEIKKLENFTFDDHGEIVETYETKREIKEQKKKTQEKKGETAPKEKPLTKYEYKDAQDKIARFEKVLLRVQKELSQLKDVDQDTGLTIVQDELISQVAESDKDIAAIYAEYLRLKNKYSSQGREVFAIKNELDAINKEIKKLKADRDAIIKEAEEAHKERSLHEDLKDKTWLERAKIIRKGLAAKVAKLVHGFRKKLIELAKLDDKISKLEKLKAYKKAELKVKQAERQDTKQKKDQAQRKTENAGIDVKATDDLVQNNIAKNIQLSKRFDTAIKKLKKKLNYPSQTATILIEQAERIDRGNFESDSGVTLKVSDYAEVKQESSSLFSSTDVGSVENKTMQKYVKMGLKFFKNSGIIDYLKQSKFNYEIAEDSPATLMLLDKNGNLNKNVTTAIIIATHNAIRNSHSSLYFRSDDDIKKMLNLSDSQLTHKHKKAFRHRTRTSNLANDIAADIINLLDIKLKKDGDIEAFERMKSSFGIMGVQYLISIGALEEEHMTREEYNKAIGIEREDADQNQDSTVSFLVRPKKDGKHIPFDKDKIEILKQEMIELEDLNLATKSMATVQFKPGKPQPAKERQIKDNPFMQMTDNMAETLNNVEAQEHELLLDSMSVLDTIMTREEALKAMGWRSEDEINADPEISLDTKEAKIAASLEKERAYDELVLLHKRLTTKDKKLGVPLHSNSLFFNYFTPKNNRISINSVLIDPQNEKEIHRWFIAPKKSKQTYSVEAINDNDPSVVGFKFGIAQAFGFDIDKKGMLKTIEFADSLLKKDRKELQAMLKRGEFDHLGHGIQAFNAIMKYKIAEKAGKETFDATITAEYDGVTNGTILKTMQLMIADNSAAILAKGGILSKGIATKLGRQLGINYEKMESILDEIESGKAALEKGEDGTVVDVYYTQAINAKLDFKSVAGRIDDANKKSKTNADFYGLSSNEDIMTFIPNATEGLTKAIRDLFKDPTMTTGYGSSLNTVRKNIAFQMANEFTDHLLNYYHIDTKGISAENKTKRDAALRMMDKIVAKHSEFKTKEDLVKAIQINTLDSISIKVKSGKYYKNSNLEEQLFNMFSPAVGEAVAEAINDTFGDAIAVTNEINKASRFMFRVFKTALEAEIVKAAELGPISNEKLIEITKSLKKFMPIFDSPGSDERLLNGIAIFDRGVTSPNNLRYKMIKKDKDGKEYVTARPVKLKWYQKDKDGNYILTKKGYKKQGSRNVRIFIRELMEAYSSAGVIPTHTEDGFDMSSLINMYMDTKGITAIHDAIVIDGKDAGTVLESMNKIIIETSKNYSLMNAIANPMRSIYNEARKADSIYNFGLDDMNNDAEKDLIKKLNDGEYIPTSFEESLFAIESMAEQSWINRERFFANEMKVDQMPGPHSMHISKPKYTKKKFIDELTERINRRTDNESRTRARNMATKLLALHDRSLDETTKINKSLDIIEAITQVLDEGC